MSKTIAIIPARGGSKRLKNKNIRLLNGIPLIAYSILFAQKSNLIDAVYVTSDNDEILEIAKDYNAIPIKRPKELSGDFEPTVTALKHVVENVEDVDTVVLLQPTNPLRPDDLLENAINEFRESNLNSLFTVSRDEHKLGKIVDNNFIPFNYTIGQRSQDLEPLYYENGLLYIVKASLILNNIIIEENGRPIIVNHPFASVDIDTIEDFEYANYLINNFKKQ